MNLKDAIEIAKNKLGKKIFQGLEITYKRRNVKGVTVKKHENTVTISYGVRADLFRGLTVIKEMGEQEEYQVSYKRSFDKNGFMLDCSRNAVGNLKALKETILIQALMGQNRLLLYTEDTYKLDKYPYFGYLRGAYTKKELKELVAYGKTFGVELIPCIQTLGHLASTLRWGPMDKLRDGTATLMVGDKEVYKFIEEMIKFSKECFGSKEIHIGMDESFELGLGKYLSKHRYASRVRLFNEHLDKVIKICKKYDFTPMIWSDMFFRLNDKNSEYYTDKPIPKSTLKMIPQGVELVYWDYYHDQKKIYDRMIQFHKETKRKVIFAGGSWRWKGFAPAIQGSIIYSVPALQSCIENNVKSVFVTAWSDNGSECSMFSTLPVLAYYSVADYTKTTDREKVDSLLKAVTGQSLEMFELMDLPDMPNGSYLSIGYNPCKYFLYQDALSGQFDPQFKPEYKENYKKHAKVLMDASKQSRDYGYVYKTLSLLCNALVDKIDLGVRLRNAYHECNLRKLNKIAAEIPNLVKKLNEFNEALRAQWNTEFKQTGFDVIDGRMGYLKNRLWSAKKMVEDFVDGKLDVIEELEGDLLPYNGETSEAGCNFWSYIVTVQNL